MKNNLKHIASVLAARLQKIDYERLPISDYNKRYIRNLKPAIGYFMQIYTECLFKGITATGLNPSDITCIDYGGGSGFLSILAKEAGIGQVIYIDLNPDSVVTVQLLKQITGSGPDIILQGSSDTLSEWCSTQHTKPHLLIATDLIEHIYNLETFFSDLISINSSMQMIFTTASTPYNPYVKWKLHRAMKGCETGTLESPNYYTKRYQYIKEKFPAFSEKEVSLWSNRTRGLVYPDIEKAILGNTIPTLTDRYNTCDPETGNWTERILPIVNYQALLSQFHYQLKVEKGFYNTERKSFILSVIFKNINHIIRNSGKPGFLLSPFIILHCSKK